MGRRAVNAANQQIVKGYELRERIGAGGFGAVYKAYQSTVGREVAIKIILPGFANQTDFIRRFESEAQLVARLEHPHITPLYDYWRDPEGAYLVMRWLRGGSLRDALQHGPFDLRSGALLLDQIAGALSVAHRNNVIHRDIKPGNILLDEDGNAYLTDFGIAKDLNLGSSQTQPDAIIGSLDYISPEQARNEPVTPRTDIYSLGVTMYEVITGQHPFPDVSTIEKLYKHINDPLPEITTLSPPEVAEAINRVIQKATAKNPQQRYADALAFAAEFREAVGMGRIPTNVVELLTPREHEILGLIIEGLSNKEIAQKLTVTLGTVKWYIKQIYDKLGVRSRVQAMVRARELHLLVKPGESIEAIPVPTEDFHPENPYKGLRAFQSADYQDFFGRERVTSKLVKRLGETGDHCRFLAVIGPSGSGKSSLVKAGLVPAIWRGELLGSEKWFVVEMLPGTRPIDELEIALTKVAANQSSNLHEQLARDQYGLARAVRLILPNDNSDLLLVIDQFEEMFTLVEDEAVRQHFFDLLVAAVNDPHSRVRIVVTLRADFYDRPLHYPGFAELLQSRLETILPLSPQELERAIIGPAERVGVKFEAGLVTAIVAEMNYQAGALPLLQYALTELFEQRKGRLLTQETYGEIGGAGSALAKRAEELYLDLTPDGQEAARQMFLRLVTLGEGTEDTRRRVPRSELLAIGISQGQASAQSSDLVDDLIDTYTNYRLLSLDNDPATRAPIVELAHEAILREWERLREWLINSRDDIKLQRQLAVLAGEWKKSQQDLSFLLRGGRLETFEKWASETELMLTATERAYLQSSLTQRDREQAAEQERQARVKALEQRSVRFLRAFIVVLFLATLGAFGLTGVALNQSNVAQQNAAEAQSLALASQAQLALNEGSVDQAVALANAAMQIRENSVAQHVLDQAGFIPGTRRIFQGAANIGGGALSSSDAPLKFVMIAHFGPEFGPFAATMIRGMEDACALLNAICRWLSPPIVISDPVEMADYWKQALALNPDGIGTVILNPNDIRASVVLASERGIPVVAFNAADAQDPDPSLPGLLYIGSDEFVSGVNSARRVFAEARGDGLTIQRGVCANQAPEAPHLAAYFAGIKSVFDEEGIPLDLLPISLGPTIPAQEIADYFKVHSITNAIFMMGPDPAAGFDLYLQQAGVKPRKLYATTRDTSPEIFQMIRDGYLLQAIDQQPYMQGFQTIIALYLYRQYGLRPSGYINTSSIIDQNNLDIVKQLVDVGYR